MVGMTVFGGATGSERRDEILRVAFGAVEWPVTWLESDGDSCDGPAGWKYTPSAGQRYGRSGCAPARSVVHGKTPLRDTANSETCATSKRRIPRPCRPARCWKIWPPRSGRRIWSFATSTAHAEPRYPGMYGDFTGCGRSQPTRVFDGLLPASTGIGAANSGDAALVCGLWHGSEDARHRGSNDRFAAAGFGH